MLAIHRLPVLPRQLILYHLGLTVSARNPLDQQRCLSTSSTPPVVDKKKYSATLRLPKTSFPLKHKDAVLAEAKYRRRTTDLLYRAQRREDRQRSFVLHDGPPYANGNLHMGHALNKVLKDIINRYHVLRGSRVNYIPGWDCHGLPIEQKALQALGQSHTTLSPERVREVARQTALDAIETQKMEFQTLGIMADWEGEAGTYRTLDHDYQIRQLRLFKRMFENGYISHRLKPVYYSPSSRTALAEAELKYVDDHTSRTVYVGFPVQEADMSPGLYSAYKKVYTGGERALELAIWTTTPWSLPGNAGVNINNDMDYALVSRSTGSMLVIAVDRRLALEQAFGYPLHVLAVLKGSDLVGTRYTHLFHPATSPLSRPSVFAASHVTSDAGTGLVHSAPAHGHDDYVAFSRAGLLPKTLRCPIDDAGCFTKEVLDFAESDQVLDLVGKSVLTEGTAIMIRLLEDNGSLLKQEDILHRYPCDWKTKEPIIVRATPQWFADVEDIKGRLSDVLDGVQFYPKQGRIRLDRTTSARSEWCISRQRSWGVPIPALYDQHGAPVLDADVFEHIIDVLEQRGIEHWWTGILNEFIPARLRGQSLHRGTDTLDVWFDSGSSWTLLQNGDTTTQADVYLEGSDQHRGWFQSSLLTKLAVAPDASAPYRTVITHGFVMDEAGQKMSKSLDNGLSPVEVVQGRQNDAGLGADTLRLWVASVDYGRDVSIGPAALGHAKETLRKIRSATRFMLGNIFDVDADISDPAVFSLVDRYILAEAHRLEADAILAYDAYNFSKVLNSTLTFLSTTLSGFYYDTIKDTLYCADRDDPMRRGIITTLHKTLGIVSKILAPILPHLAEELYEHLRPAKPSIFLDTWVASDPRDHVITEEMLHHIRLIQTIRSKVVSLVEEARQAGHVRLASQTDLIIVGMEPGVPTACRHDIIKACGTANVIFDQMPVGMWRRLARNVHDAGEAWRPPARSSVHAAPMF